MLPADEETASKYNARIIVSHYQDTQRKRTYDGSVLSIEDLPNTEDYKAKYWKYWFVAYNALEPFIKMDLGFDTVPITVEVFENEKKRKRMG